MNWIFKNKKMPCEKSTSEFFCKLKNILCCKKTKTILVVLVLMCIVYVFLPHSVLGAKGLDGATATATGTATKTSKGFAETLAYYLIGKPLEGVQNFMILLLTGAVTILETMLNPDAMSGKNGLLNSTVVKDIWVMTRDTMNMCFILILLFSAFCTIFQVEKWNLKKVWLAILINALLVNFSFPIARFFIDVSNVAMYYFLNNMFTGATSGTSANGSSIAASFGTYASLSGIFTPTKFADAPIFFELAIIIFTFIFAITLLVLAVLFVIRLIALGLIVMFSPIGFVGFIFPGTQKFASDWWSNLFKYAFFGPIMVFMMSIALQVSSVISSKTTFSASAVKNVGSTGSIVDSTYVAQIATFAMPIIILWMAMGISKKMGIAGSDMVVGKAEGFAKGVGAWVAKAPWRAAKWGANATGIPGGIKKGWQDARKSGKLFGKDIGIIKDRQEEREAKIAGGFSGGSKGYKGAVAKKRLKDFNEKVKEQKENHNSLTASQLVADINVVVTKDNALEVASKYQNLISDSTKKDAHEAQMIVDILNDPALAATLASFGTDKDKKDAFVKQQVAAGWDKLRAKHQEAQTAVTS